MTLRLLLPLLVASSAVAFLPFTNPPWGADNWGVLGASTLTMACNSSSFFDPSLAAQFGVVSFDWRLVWPAPAQHMREAPRLHKREALPR